MSKPKIQTCSTSGLVIEEGDWIPIIPVGKVSTFDGRGPFYVKNATKVIANSLRPTVELVVERDHVTDHASPGTPAPAAGWIKELKEENGMIMARVEWTPPAKLQLQNREYRYISPVFMHDDQNQVTRILRASLVNFPAIEMKAVAAADPQSLQTQTENTMDEQLKELAALLGLEGDTVSFDAIKEAIGALQATKEAVKEAVDAPAEADTAEAIVSAVEAHVEEEKTEAVEAARAQFKATASAKGNPDPSKYVPIAAFDELKDTVANLSAAQNETKVTAAVDQALKDGKITPAQKAWAQDYATKDPEGFKTYVDKSPRLVAASATLPGAYRPEKNDAGITGSQASVAAQLGIKPEKMKA